MNHQSTVFVVDDDTAVRNGLALQLELANFRTKAFISAAKLLDHLSPQSLGCLLLDINMPEMTGLELQKELANRKISLPIIFLTGHGNIQMAVRAIQAGAMDFLTKPIDGQALVDLVHAALLLNVEQRRQAAISGATSKRLKSLTVRENEVLALALEGLSNKAIARHFNISIRTVENHRSHILLKTESSNLLELARISFTSHVNPIPESLLLYDERCHPRW